MRARGKPLGGQVQVQGPAEIETLEHQRRNNRGAVRVHVHPQLVAGTHVGERRHGRQHALQAGAEGMEVDARVIAADRRHRGEQRQRRQLAGGSGFDGIGLHVIHGRQPR
ncbi:hypothetical protein D3C76_1173760 [compost metagenome]